MESILMAAISYFRNFSPIFALGSALLVGNSAWSATVPSFTTGVNSDGTFAALGSADPHWKVVAGPGITSPQAAVVLTTQRNPLGTYYTTTDSEWIWVAASGVAGTYSPYTFELSFDLTDYDPASTVITGYWGVDNVASIEINGVAATGSGALSLTNSSNFTTPNYFSVTGPFHSGINTIDILATDYGYVGGLDITDLTITATPTASAVPEPSSWALLLSGLGGLGWRSRRSKKR